MDFTILTTGGTIDKHYSSTKGTYDFTIGKPQIQNVLTHLPEKQHTYQIQDLFQLDSLDMKEDHREVISNACEEVDSDRILITHGTDSIIETAKRIEEESLDKTIVLTGSSKPERMKNSDADFNIGLSLGALQTLPDGVYIAIHGTIHSIPNLYKTEDGLFEKE